MNADYRSISEALKKIEDLQAQTAAQIKQLKDCISCASCTSSLSKDSSKKQHVDSAADKLQRKLDAEQSLIDSMWEDKVYKAVCPDAENPLDQDELKNFGFGISAEDYAAYLEDFNKLQEANLS